MSETPFVILSLPRSRTAWLSRFLSPEGGACGHDLAVECRGLDDFADGVLRLGGTVETGAADVWSAIRSRLPQAKIVVLRRPVDEVLASFARLGVSGIDEQIERRARILDHVSSLPRVHTIRHAALASEAGCAWLYEHCLGIPHSREWWLILAGTNIQIDMGARLMRLRDNRETLDRLKEEFGDPDPGPSKTVIAVEPFASVWPEVEVLGGEHFAETDTNVEPMRKYNLVAGPMELANRSGMLRVFSARQNGSLVGYLMWHVVEDVEAGGMIVGNQGPWFVRNIQGRAGVALALWERSKAELRGLGVQCLYPHHRMQGRGKSLGRFFERQGGKAVKIEYSLWIGDSPSG